MSNSLKRKNVTFDDLIKALDVVVAYHEQRGLTFIVANTEAGILVRGGNSFQLEALVNQCKLYIEGQNNVTFVNAHVARDAAMKQAKEEKKEEGND